MSDDTKLYRVVCRIFQTDKLIRQSEPKSFGKANQEADAMRSFRDACLDYRGEKALPFDGPDYPHHGELMSCFVAIRVEPVKVAG